MTRQVFSRDTRLDCIKSAIALARGGHPEEARAWAVARWGEAGTPVEITRAATGSITEGNMGSALLADTALFAAVREQAVLFRLRGTRRVTFKRTRMITGGGTTAFWLGEGQAMPITKPVFDVSGLENFKLGAATIATKEALDLGAGVEALIFADLVAAIVDELDATLLDPTNAGVADVAPAAITNGLTAVTATADPVVDMANLIAAFDGNLRNAYFTMNAKTAALLAGTNLGRDIGLRGGELLGAPVLTSNTAPTTSLSLIDPAGLLVAHEDSVLLSSTEAGAIEASDAPTHDSDTPANLVSLFQVNARAFKGVLPASWKIARPGSVAVLQGGGTDWMAGA